MWPPLHPATVPGPPRALKLVDIWQPSRREHPPSAPTTRGCCCWQAWLLICSVILISAPASRIPLRTYHLFRQDNNNKPNNSPVISRHPASHLSSAPGGSHQRQSPIPPWETQTQRSPAAMTAAAVASTPPSPTPVQARRHSLAESHLGGTAIPDTISPGFWGALQEVRARMPTSAMNARRRNRKGRPGGWKRSGLPGYRSESGA